jgi:orotate phosphoribosyltransferase
MRRKFRESGDSIALFESGAFNLHSGHISSWRINAEALSDASLATLASIMANCIGHFGSVEGVPDGGLRFAAHWRPYVTSGPVLIVDDVLTTGASIEEQRAGRDAIGLVIFARGPCPSWVKAVWSLNKESE